jgi:thiol-disulfide isomerase/thioredoxin
MKKIFAILLASLGFSCSNAQKTAFSESALNEKLLSVNDGELYFKEILKKHSGKTVVIEFWASWCGDCVKAMPKIKEIQEQNPEVVYLFISFDKTTEKWKEGMEKHELKGFHYLALDGMKGKFGSAVDLDWIPRYMVIDKSGKIVIYRAIETDFEEIAKTIQLLK